MWEGNKMFEPFLIHSCGLFSFTLLLLYKISLFHFCPCPFWCQSNSNNSKLWRLPSAIKLQTVFILVVWRCGQIVVYRVGVIKSSGNDQGVVVVVHKCSCWWSNARILKGDGRTFLQHVGAKDAVKSKLLTHVLGLVEGLVPELPPVLTFAKYADGQHHQHHAESDAEADGDVLLRTD